MAQDPYKYFRIEGRELLAEMGKGVLDLERGPASAELLSRLLRLAHTLKGAARVVKQPEIADGAHAVEDALAPFREGGSTVPRERVDALLALLDEMGARLGALGAPSAPSEAEPAAAAPSTTATPPPEETFRTLRADLEEMDTLQASVTEVTVQLGGARSSAGALDKARHLSELLCEQLAPRTRGADGVPFKVRALAEEVRTLVARVERELAASLEQVDRELRQVREAAERLRLLPAGMMFHPIERALRDAAQTLGKRVVFETQGGDVRLDAHVLGALQSALVQVARNAVAHGIEPAAEREAAGKPSEGRVRLEVTRRGSRVSFACRDDGRGVDLEAVRRVAKRRGLLAGDASQLGPEDLLRLLLAGGISTSGTVTEVAGRGIGLDVVREAASRLGGKVTVRTEARRGTTVEIVVPLSLFSLDALIVEANGRAAAIPLDAVKGTLRVAAADVARTAKGEAIQLEGEVLPFAPLARCLHGETSAAPRAWSAVVVEGGGVRAAVGVDRLIGTENVVLRALPARLPAAPVVAGASLDAEGNPQMVLDPEGLVAEARREDAFAAPKPDASPPPILVIDDSLTTRMLERSILESAGYEVDVAASAEEGMEMARHRRYALFLVDVEMPGMDGFTFVERTRADATLGHTPAILVTSRSAPEDRRRGEEVGASAYVVKSEFEQTELLERIRNLVGA